MGAGGALEVLIKVNGDRRILASERRPVLRDVRQKLLGLFLSQSALSLVTTHLAEPHEERGNDNREHYYNYQNLRSSSFDHGPLSESRRLKAPLLNQFGYYYCSNESNARTSIGH